MGQDKQKEEARRRALAARVSKRCPLELTSGGGVNILRSHSDSTLVALSYPFPAPASTHFRPLTFIFLAGLSAAKDSQQAVETALRFACGTLWASTFACLLLLLMLDLLQTLISLTTYLSLPSHLSLSLPSLLSLQGHHVVRLQGTG